MYQIVIVDDDPIQLDHTAALVNALLQEHPAQVHCFSSAKQIDLASELIPHIAVLDIELGGAENGMDVAHKLQQRSPNCQVIFLTNHMDYISDVYEVPHLYLLLKSKMQQYLPKALSMALENLTRSEEAVFWLRHKTLNKRLLQRDILAFERYQRITLVYTTQCELRTPTSLTSIDPLVDKERFVRCHQSFLVNMDYVAQHSLDCFLLTNGQSVPISRQYQQAVRTKFLKHIAQSVQI